MYLDRIQPEDILHSSEPLLLGHRITDTSFTIRRAAAGGIAT